ELGIHLKNCRKIAQDLSKIFEVYWIIGASPTIPTHWPSFLDTNINKETPLKVNFGSPTDIYISSSPKQLNPNGRTNDIDALLDVINSAQKFIYIAVMDYAPEFIYIDPHRYWPPIDDALKTAAIERNVSVRLLPSTWQHTEQNMFTYLRSLYAFSKFKGAGTIEVKLFSVPPLSYIQIPYTRVNHNKYMVTEKHAYIGTSNWSADYFVNTGGVAFVANSTKVSNETIRGKLESIFLRDWSSPYAIPLPSQ
ncbi:phospholipase D3-like protein, partial [Leptotrombidium deliense]